MSKTVAQSEFERIKREAAACEGKTPEERTIMFLQLMEALYESQAHLTPDERERQRQIAEQLVPRPEPWWRNFRKEALEEYELTHAAELKELDQLIAIYSRDTADNI